MSDELFARDPDLFRKIHEVLAEHDKKFPGKQSAAPSFYICSRCGSLYQSMYGCGCPATWTYPGRKP